MRADWLLLLFLATPHGMWDLIVPRSGIEPGLPALGVQSLNQVPRAEFEEEMDN